MKVASVLLPTRGRPEGLVNSIWTLVNKAVDLSRVEILIYIDEDDKTDYFVLDQFKGIVEIRKTVGKRYFYYGLHNYYNILAELAVGRWCLLWNDDVSMDTVGWDVVLDGTPGQIAVAGTEANHGRSPIIFPIFTREFVSAMGHVSLNCHNDTWIEDVSSALGIQIPVEIKVVHKKFDDATEHQENPTGDPSHGYYSKEMAMARMADIERVREYMKWRR